PTIDMACPQDEVPPAEYDDVAPNIHTPAIDCVSWWGVAQGKADGTYGPLETVRRDQMATFIVRALEAAGYVFESEPEDAFTDDDDSTHHHAINQLAAAGIVKGSGGGSAYDPAGTVSRGQMAAFLVRAYEELRQEPLPPGTDFFTDDDGTAHEAAIDKARAAWIVTGRSDDQYEPHAPVLRQEMATFLARLLDAFTGEGYAAPPAS
ncbi:MAG: S-layer homology domain-containing protein, partial [Actinobacteria bacterium]|nr:S-layer homology domain-containing protein [Actinomycetota bacterium]